MVELRLANASLTTRSLTDPLTGIANRRQFDEVLPKAFKAVPLGQSAGQRILARASPPPSPLPQTMRWRWPTISASPFAHAGHSVGPA